MKATTLIISAVLALQVKPQQLPLKPTSNNPNISSPDFAKLADWVAFLFYFKVVPAVQSTLFLLVGFAVFPLYLYYLKINII
jgi:hypothetical protein